MDWSKGSKRIIAGAAADACLGVVRWSPVKSIWIGSMTLTALIGGPLLFEWGAVAVFGILSVVTLCCGHSVGMHRRLIHESFDCPRWLEYALVYLGVLVGMAGPFGLMKQHDLRDWAQRQTQCHDYLRHGRGMLLDVFWQLHCDLKLRNPPCFQLEPRLAADTTYARLERSWMWHQVPLAVLLYAAGGLSWVVWGVAVRVTVCVTGHWLVGYFAHNQRMDSPMRWNVEGAGVQGRDVPIAALFSMGESWHNNHHAYPGSARLGLDDDQPDPGWLFIRVLQAFGLAWNVKTPAVLPRRSSLVRVSEKAGGSRFMRAALNLLRWLRAQWVMRAALRDLKPNLLAQ